MSLSNIISPDAEQIKVVEALAKEIDQPVEAVDSAFASILNTLKSNARIHDYLVVLTSKKVRDVLRH